MVGGPGSSTVCIRGLHSALCIPYVRHGRWTHSDFSPTAASRSAAQSELYGVTWPRPPGRSSHLLLGLVIPPLAFPPPSSPIATSKTPSRAWDVVSSPSLGAWHIIYALFHMTCLCHNIRNSHSVTFVRVKYRTSSFRRWLVVCQGLFSITHQA